MTDEEEAHQDWLVEHLFYNDWSFSGGEDHRPQ